MDKKPNEIHESLIPTKLTTIPYSTNFLKRHITKTYLRPAFLAVNNEYTSSYALICGIFRCSLQNGSVPKDWKQANVVPVYNKGNHQYPSPYRPISLTSIVSKLLEKIISSHVMKHLESYNMLMIYNMASANTGHVKPNWSL